MPLPRSIRPEYTTTIPSSGKKIKYQPFSVKEEKVLILAAEGQDPEEIASAVSNVLKACVTSPADFKVEDLALFDVEFLFLKARAKSAGEKISVRVTDPDDTSFTTDVDINIDKIGVQRKDDHTDKVDLGEDVSIIMRYPDITFFESGLQLENIDGSLKTIARCVKQIVAGEEVYNRSDMSDEELVEWIEELTTDQLSKILNFFTTMPKLSHTVKSKNKNNGKEFSVTLEGLADFF